VHAELQRRGDAVVVLGDGSSVRVVEAPSTAATVIESWVRTDVEAPLLAVRPLAADEPAASAATSPAASVDTAVVARRPPPRGVQLFAAGETSFASDRSSWVGVGVGACVMIGPVCAAARLRFSTLAWGAEEWHGEAGRSATELLVGGDIPLRVGGFTISPGFAAGIGMTHTRLERDGMVARAETGGLRADVHASLSLPLRRRLAFEVSVAGDLTQSTHVESSSSIQLPEEPRTQIRVGVGLRYGGL